MGLFHDINATSYPPPSKYDASNTKHRPSLLQSDNITTYPYVLSVINSIIVKNTIYIMCSIN